MSARMIPKILIIGAGPVGLCLAADLFRRGIPSKIVDQKPTITPLSKAMGIQSGVLRCIDQTFGKPFSTRLIQAGYPAQNARIHFGDHEEVILDLTQIPKPYPFVLILEQSKTEFYFNEALESFGGAVIWNEKVNSVINNGNSVSVEFSSGIREDFDFVIGCDGAHSVVRSEMKEPFFGDEYFASFALADAKIEWDRPHGIHAFLQKNGILVFFPYKDQNIYRVIYAIKGESRETPIDIATFQREMGEILKDPPRLIDANWVTRFSVHHRMVKHFQKGRLFLAGDTAHIHSPVGGQGMNLGIQDALSLSCKLDAFSKGKELPLSRYSHERFQVAKKIVSGTDKITQFLLKKDSFLTEKIRSHLIPFIASQHWIQKKVLLTLSQIPLAEKEIALYQST